MGYPISAGMNEHRDDTAAYRKRRRDRRVKLGFGLVAMAAVVVIFLLGRRGPSLPGWGEDLDAALKKAKAENRPILVFFIPSGYSAEAEQVAEIAKKEENLRALEKGRFLRVRVKVDSPGSKPARRHRVKHLPTVLILDSNGEELNRRERKVGQVAFRRGFLDCTEVQKP